MQTELLNFCEQLNADTVAGTSSAKRFNKGTFRNILTNAAKDAKANLAHRLAYADSRGKKTASGKQAPSELQGLETCASICELLDGLKAIATDKRYWREVSVPSLTRPGKGKTLIDLVMIPPAQDTVQGHGDALTGALKSLGAADRAAMFRELLELEAPDVVAGMDGESDSDEISDLIEGVRRQARRQGRIEAKGDRQGARQDNRAQRKQAATAARAEGSAYDDGDIFIAQDTKMYARTPQRRLLPVVTSTSGAGGQNSLANGVSVTLTGAPSVELEIIKMRIIVEGGATNIEIQETLVASFAITSLKIGSVDLIVGTGGVEFPMGDSVDPTFWSCLVVTGGNSNLTVTVLNQGATQVFNVSAYCRIVVPV